MSRIFASMTALFVSVASASAQFVIVPAPQPVVPIVSYSFSPSAPVIMPQPVTPSASFYAPQGPVVSAPVMAPTTVFYQPAPVAAPVVAPVAVPGVVTTRTETWGLGIFRPRTVTTQQFVTPLFR